MKTKTVVNLSGLFAGVIAINLFRLPFVWTLGLSFMWGIAWSFIFDIFVAEHL